MVCKGVLVVGPVPVGGLYGLSDGNDKNERDVTDVAVPVFGCQSLRV